MGPIAGACAVRGPAPRTGPTCLGCLPQDQRGSGAARQGKSRQGSTEGMASGVYPYPSPRLHPNGRTLTEHVPCLELCWDRTVTKTVPALPSQGSVPGQEWDRGAQKIFALQTPRAEPRLPRETQHFLVSDHRGERWDRKQDPQRGKKAVTGQGMTEEEERGWRPEMGGWTPLTPSSSSSSCDTPCCWGDRELGHLSPKEKGRSVIRSKALSAPPMMGRRSWDPFNSVTCGCDLCRDGETHSAKGPQTPSSFSILT